MILLRLMIARAIAPKHKILMFDEATSALDNKTQKQVCEALDGLDCTRMNSSFSSAVFAVDDDWGDEWETEEVAPVVTESSVPQQESQVQPDGSPAGDGNDDTTTAKTGEASAVIPLLIAGTGAAAAVFVFSLRKQKQDKA